MNRENKKRKYDKKYFRTHPCMDPFTCKVCGWPVMPAGAGSSHRNHCPNCLYSLHLDREPGDRASDCHGRMEPIGVWVRKNGEWAIIHRCLTGRDPGYDSIHGKLGSGFGKKDNCVRVILSIP